MKKVFVLMLSFMVILVFATGCASDSDEEYDENGEVVEEEVEGEDYVPPAELDEYIYTWETNDGYTFQATIKYSPWINTENPILKSTWAEVTDSTELPDTDHSAWGSLYSDTKFNTSYYCVGQVYIENLTEGWDLSESNPFENGLAIYLTEAEENAHNYPVSQYGHISGKFFMDGEEVLSDDMGVTINTGKMTNNSWGPYPFVLAHFDSVTPNNPEGEYIDELSKQALLVSSMGQFDGYIPPLDIIEADDSPEASDSDE